MKEISLAKRVNLTTEYGPEDTPGCDYTWECTCQGCVWDDD